MLGHGDIKKQSHCVSPFSEAQKTHMAQNKSVSEWEVSAEDGMGLSLCSPCHSRVHTAAQTVLPH